MRKFLIQPRSIGGKKSFDEFAGFHFLDKGFDATRLTSRHTRKAPSVFPITGFGGMGVGKNMLIVQVQSFT
ncbi:MAG TPA: hypothetical protein VFW78_01620 [Bacteroidia bacterium]|nr:hypothetical protein [Bacteroidia bacterium]